MIATNENEPNQRPVSQVGICRVDLLRRIAERKARGLGQPREVLDAFEIASNDALSAQADLPVGQGDRASSAQSPLGASEIACA
jgi:hypothetical protein